MSVQDFKNHRQYVPGYHIVTFTLLLLILAASGFTLFTAFRDHFMIRLSTLIFLIAVALFFIFFYLRIFALKAQDRAIRSEEMLRHFVLTGKKLSSDLDTLQIVALRFASDEEFPSLAEKAARENLSPAEIKKNIKAWKPDYYRV